MRRRIILEGEKSGGRYIIDGHEVVDLVLPSGTLWATCNVGASNEGQFGNYYQYGKGRWEYQQTSGDTYYEGTESQLALSADTAYQLWGSNWRMPTKDECLELMYNTTYEWITNYNGSGVKGGKFISVIDESQCVFIPASGYYEEGTLHQYNNAGYIWSSVPYGNYRIYQLAVDSGFPSIAYNFVTWGVPVRPIVNY